MNAVDKMAEIRTCPNGTCNLQSYGDIFNTYDKLIANPSYSDRNADENHIILQDIVIIVNYMQMFKIILII